MRNLTVKALFAGYRRADVLKGVSFSVEHGEIAGIVGPNGSGKTTLLRAMTRIIRPHAGEVILDGVNVAMIPLAHFARRVAVIPQMVESPFSFTVEEFVLMGRFPYAGPLGSVSEEDERKAGEALRFTGMYDIKGRYLNELSGGERQRAVLAQGFAQEPELLILDEPTAHLDITHQVNILDSVRRLKKERGLTVITVLHDLNLASEYCDRIIMLDSGRIAAMGSPQEVLTYQNIESVYKTIVVVEKNPVSGRPHTLLIPRS